MVMQTRLLCIVLMLSSSVIRAEDAATFTSEPFSLTISAPRTWKLVPATFPTEEYAIRKKNLQELVAREKQLPIVRIVKPVEGNRTISPAVQVFVVPDEGMSPKEFLSSGAETAGAAFENFRISRAASDTTLNGIKAAAIESTFTTAYPGDRHFPTLSRMWAIPRDKMIFVITVTGQPEDLKKLASDIELILKSIRFKSQ